MKQLIYIATILFFAIPLTHGQKNDVPKDINAAISFLQLDCSDSLQQIIKETADDNLINICYPWNGKYKTIFHWIKTDRKKSKIRDYLIAHGIESNIHQQTIILIAFKKHLLGLAINENEIIEPYKKIEDKWRAEDKVRFTADSIRNTYIPRDIEDCFKQIDSFWDDSTKNIVKKWTEDEFSSNAHFGFGMWMRNNWQLWGGSRLSKYFNELGVSHPDDMSGIILDSYHRYLTGKEIKLEEQIKFYHNYWKVTVVPSKKLYPKKSGKLNFDSNLYYKSKTNGHGSIHVGINSRTDEIWIYDFYMGWSKISEKELEELENANIDVREDIAKKIYANK